MKTKEYSQTILQELTRTLGGIPDAEAEGLADEILGAKRVFVAGAGRSLLMVRAFAMRLMQFGFHAYVVGETVTPAISKGDLFLIGSGSGETGALTLMAEKAKSVGARLALITIVTGSTIGLLSDRVIEIKAPSPKAKPGNEAVSVQPGGSLFEQSLLLFLDALVLRIAEKRGIKDENGLLMQNHANLE
jgi:6-phospho-3-hexuloisomerase